MCWWHCVWEKRQEQEQHDGWKILPEVHSCPPHKMLLHLESTLHVGTTSSLTRPQRIYHLDCRWSIENGSTDPINELIRQKKTPRLSFCSSHRAQKASQSSTFAKIDLSFTTELETREIGWSVICFLKAAQCLRLNSCLVSIFLIRVRSNYGSGLLLWWLNFWVIVEPSWVWQR